ncbi:DUF1499 domain-containing protein [Halomonas sp. McH1-25]|uniref:DUF1499 domain-containing protein n=1 Tax=unclassified Halomonas TaxID=2609666 RepID=UPI001EF43D33|nr:MULTISPECIES: DUF1499 domain-containing protein [unclassified Halomonas]MCG7601062.1 DUF1499 domain-containing protein [Halomonas sp. McH1-25]MCP1343851.1 DUF1499 domain-containing protein [Halomonas sp. FL8]MCP1361226.1 DUF1499 domain-containing protein [Halomonas sp. BBD45]MCP1367742.1 DUF1499 domain-containing protein [Halomonas sp. BBD48]
MLTNPMTSKRPINLGVEQGRLAACPAIHNCVCSQADDQAHYVAPFSAPGMTGKEILARLASALHACEEAEVITQTDAYLHAECHSAWLGFVDDLELFWSEDENVCHVRSASRLGLSDLGKNRARVEKLRMLLEGWGFCD